ncbi:uncharacterized protein L199_005742 [Kwoniella botswanensis]|uniref:uncharacterized protein n=1 Tax=Kwoniella botswanensis TaxID=1268659 RepID=UPI00315C9F0B
MSSTGTAQGQVVPLGQYITQFDTATELVGKEKDVYGHSDPNAAPNLIKNRVDEFLTSHGDTQCGSKTFNELVSDLYDVNGKGRSRTAILPPPTSTDRPTCIQLTGRSGSIVSHNAAMTKAIWDCDPLAQALIGTIQAIDGYTIPISKAEIDTLCGSVLSHLLEIRLNGQTLHGRYFDPTDLQTLNRTIDDAYKRDGARPEEDTGHLTISLNSLPDFQVGKPVTSPMDTKRFITTLKADLGHSEHQFNSILSNASLGRSLTHHEKSDIMSPSFLRDMNKYMVYEGYSWNPTELASERLPQASEVLYEKDPWVKEYRESMLDKEILLGTTSQAFRSKFRPQELLIEGEKLLIDRGIQSVTDASRARACAACGGSDPGPTVSEYLRSQDPLKYALSVLKKEHDEDELDTSDPFAIEPFLPHSALPALRERQSTLA